MQHGSEHVCSTALGCITEEVSLAKAFEEQQIVLGCLNFENKGKLMKNGHLNTTQKTGIEMHQL